MTSGIAQVRLFGEIANFRNGVNFPASSRDNGNLAVIGVGDFQDNERIARFDQLERIVRPSNLDDESLLQSGDLIFVRSNGNKALIGRCMKVESVNVPLTHSGFTIRARLKTDAVDSEWIAQFFSTGLAKRAIARRGGGTNISNLSQEILQDLPIPIPKAGFQEKVLSVSAKHAGMIEAFDKQIEAKREFKRGLAQQLLTGKKRFPTFREKPWHTSSLDAHVKPITRKNTDGCTLVLTASGQHGLVDQRRYFNRRVASVDLSKYYLLQRGEFAYNRSAMSGYPYGATKRLEEHEEGALSVLYLCFAIFDPRLDSDFLRHVFDSGVLNRQLRPIVRVGARAHGLLNVSDDDFLSISIPFPELEEQRKIARLLDDLAYEIALLTTQRENFSTYKRDLFARLLSGGLPVPA